MKEMISLPPLGGAGNLFSFVEEIPCNRTFKAKISPVLFCALAHLNAQKIECMLNHTVNLFIGTFDTPREDGVTGDC